MYRSLIRKEWRTLDVIEFAEPTVHRIVRKETTAPPYLTAERKAPDEVHMHRGSGDCLLVVKRA